MKKFILIGIVVILIGAVAVMFFNPGHDNKEYKPDYNNLISKKKNNTTYGVTSDNSRATQAGMQILEQGGNAVDAAIAVSYVLGVTDIYGSGIGGGGMMLVDSPDIKPEFYDYQVTAPKYGEIPNDHIGIPGVVAGMRKVHDDHGTMSMSKLIEPAINIAEHGFEADQILHDRLEGASYRMPVEKLPELYPNGHAVEKGDTIKQKKLANTLRDIQKQGADAFYNGEIAEKIDKAVDGIDIRDMKNYEVLKKEPIHGRFAGFDVYTAGPPGGGTSFMQTLKLAEAKNISTIEDHSLNFIQLMGNIHKEVYQDKIHHMGDPDYTDVDADDLLSKNHIKKMSNKLKEEYSLHKQDQNPVTKNSDRNGNTTHFVVVDQNGMMVSATNTLSNFFGSGKHVSGMFLNNELRIFSDRKSSPNYAEPGKRPASYMAPTILSKNDIPAIGIGSSGGSRIPALMGQVVIRMLKFDQSPKEAVDASRAIVDEKNDDVAIEEDYPNRQKVIDKLEDKDYLIDHSQSKRESYFGSVQTLIVNQRNHELVGGSDPRRGGKWNSN